MDNLEKRELKKYILLISYAILFYYVITNFSSVLRVVSTSFGILSPFIMGFALAFILNKPFIGFRDKVFIKLKKKNKERQIVKLLV